MKKYLFAAIIIVIISGCNGYRGLNFEKFYYNHNTSGVVTGDIYPSLTTVEKVKIFLTGEAPEFEVVGMIQVITTLKIYRIDTIVEDAETKAREMGANIIALEGKVIMKSKTETNSNTTDSNGNKKEENSVTKSDYPTFTFIAGRLK